MGGSVPGGGRAGLVTIPGIEAAVMLHAGRAGDIDQTYGALGTVDLILMLRYSRKQLPPPRTEAEIDKPIPAVQY